MTATATCSSCSSNDRSAWPGTAAASASSSRGGSPPTAAPSGLRRLLFDRCRVDEIVGFENSRGIFPIHRSTRFLLFTASTGARTDVLPCRLGLRDAQPLETGTRRDRRDHSPPARPALAWRPLAPRRPVGDRSLAAREADDGGAAAVRQRRVGRRVRSRVERHRRRPALHERGHRRAGARGQGHRAVPRVDPGRWPRAAHGVGEGPSGTSELEPAPHRLSRRGERHQPPHPDRGRRPRRRGHRPHALLPQDEAGRAGPGLPVRASQQLRCQLPGPPSRDDARDGRNRGPPSRASSPLDVSAPPADHRSLAAASALRRARTVARVPATPGRGGEAVRPHARRIRARALDVSAH